MSLYTKIGSKIANMAEKKATKKVVKSTAKNVAKGVINKNTLPKKEPIIRRLKYTVIDTKRKLKEAKGLKQKSKKAGFIQPKYVKGGIGVAAGLASYDYYTRKRDNRLENPSLNLNEMDTKYAGSNGNKLNNLKVFEKKLPIKYTEKAKAKAEEKLKVGFGHNIRNTAKERILKKRAKKILKAGRIRKLTKAAAIVALGVGAIKIANKTIENKYGLNSNKYARNYD
jgi:hypothetical protein